MRRVTLCLLALAACDDTTPSGAALDLGADAAVVDAQPAPVDAAAPCAPGVDTDEDGLADCAELRRRTRPDLPDTDGNGLTDGRLVIGERLVLAGPFTGAPPAVRLGQTALAATLRPDGDLEVAVAGPAGRQALAVGDEDWMTLEVVRLRLVVGVGAALWRADGAGAPIEPALPLPSRPGALVLSPDGATAWITCPGAGALLAVDVPRWRRAGDLALDGLPAALALDGAVAVARPLANAVSLVDLAPLGERAEIALDELPAAVSVGDGRLAVSLPGRGEVLLFAWGGEGPGAPTAVPLPAGFTPRASAWSPAAGAFVVLGGEGALALIEPEAAAATLIPLPVIGATTLALAPGGAVALVGGLDGQIVAVGLLPDPEVGAPLALEAVPGVPGFLDAERAWVPESFAMAPGHPPGDRLLTIRLRGVELAVEDAVPGPDGPWMVVVQPEEVP